MYRSWSRLDPQQGTHLCQVGWPSKGRAIDHLAPGSSLHVRSQASGFEHQDKGAPDDANWGQSAAKKLAKISWTYMLNNVIAMIAYLSKYAPQHISEAVVQGLQLPLLLLHSCRLRW